jgi:methionyl-tRNA formyltransferase
VEIAAVYTQPDRPAGRGRQLTPSQLKLSALAAGLPVEQPQTLKDAAVQSRLREWDLDLLIVVAYGLILPRKVLSIPRLGCWNVHASLLPRWRGAAPIQRALLAGDRETGVCLMQMEAGLDTGPVLLQRKCTIPAQATGGSLHDDLAALGAECLGEALRHTLAGETLPAKVQSSAGVTYAHKLDKAEARLHWHEPAAVLERKVRAFDPWPVAEADIAGEAVRIWRAVMPEKNAVGQTAGSIIAAGKEGIDVACGEGVLRVLELQRSGGRRMPVGAYLNSRPELA